MNPVLLPGTLFANVLFLQKSLPSQAEDHSQLWEAFYYLQKKDVLLQIFSESNPQSAKAFKENLAFYREIESSHLIPVITFDVDLNNVPYLVMPVRSSVPLESLKPIITDRELANLLSQLTEALLALHTKGLSPQDMSTRTVETDSKTYLLPPTIQALSDDGTSDLLALGKLCTELAPALSPVDDLNRLIKQGADVKTIKGIADHYLAESQWKWVSSEYDNNVSTLPGNVEPPTEPVSEPEGKTPGEETTPPFFNTWRLAGIAILTAVATYWVWPKGPFIVDTRSSNATSTYLSLLNKGKQLVQADKKDSAIIAFKEAVQIQKKNNLPESVEAKKLAEAYKGNADKQFSIINDPAMYDMMDVPMSYYQLVAALQDSKEIQARIAECECLWKKHKPCSAL